MSIDKKKSIKITKENIEKDWMSQDLNRVDLATAMGSLSESK